MSDIGRPTPNRLDGLQLGTLEPVVPTPVRRWQGIARSPVALVGLVLIFTWVVVAAFCSDSLTLFIDRAACDGHGHGAVDASLAGCGCP